MEISLEIVPRDPRSLRADADAGAASPGITCINIPDLRRFSLRSWDAAALLAGPDGAAEPGASPGAPAALPGAAPAALPLIPHLRARDFSPDEAFPLKDFFRERGIQRALVIAGDPEDPELPAAAFAPGGGGTGPGAGSPTVPFIKKLKAELPELEIYAAFDPYRTNIRYELDYLAAKEEAGASGFMSQPFFDLRLLEIYAEYLEGKNVFWGLAPVLGEGNRRYWESRNRAVFPRSFRPGLDWNTGFARRVLAFCRSGGFNLYLMPIKVDIGTYLSGIFGP